MLGAVLGCLPNWPGLDEDVEPTKDTVDIVALKKQTYTEYFSFRRFSVLCGQTLLQAPSRHETRQGAHLKSDP